MIFTRGIMRYSSLDPHYLSKLDDVVLMHTATQYSAALAQLGEEGTEARAQIVASFSSVVSELERRGLRPEGWQVEVPMPSQSPT